MDRTDDYLCKRCGERYDPSAQEIPEDASYYWVPHCPECNAKLTVNTVDDIWLNVVGSDLDRLDDYETFVNKLNAHARLYHGRMADVGSEELIEMARFFDSRVDYGFRVSSQQDRVVAFNLRRQAREMVTS